MNSLSSQVIADILVNELALPNANVFLRDQNRKIPNDTGVYIAVGIVAAYPMSNISYLRQTTPQDWDAENGFWDIDGEIYDTAGQPIRWDLTGQTWDQPNQLYDQVAPLQIEVSEVQVKEMVQIDFLSRSNDGIFRNWEVVAALQSFYAQQQMEANNFKIFRIPQNWINTSSAEGGSIINRYTITFPVFVWYRKQKVLTTDGGDYYDDFHQRVDNDRTIGTPTPMIEFEINQEGIEP